MNESHQFSFSLDDLLLTMIYVDVNSISYQQSNHRFEIGLAYCQLSYMYDTISYIQNHPMITLPWIN